MVCSQNRRCQSEYSPFRLRSAVTPAATAPLVKRLLIRRHRPAKSASWGWQRHDRVHVIGQDHDCINGKRALDPRCSKSTAQYGDMIDQRAGLPVYERSREEKSPARNQVAPISHHRAKPDPVCTRRSNRRLEQPGRNVELKALIPHFASLHAGYKAVRPRIDLVPRGPDMHPDPIRIRPWNRLG